jgi:hypothetical protein
VSGHKYKIGQLVNYLSRDATSGVYQVTQLIAARRRSVSVSHQERQRASRTCSQRERTS